MMTSLCVQNAVTEACGISPENFNQVILSTSRFCVHALCMLPLCGGLMMNTVVPPAGAGREHFQGLP